MLEKAPINVALALAALSRARKAVASGNSEVGLAEIAKAESELEAIKILGVSLAETSQILQVSEASVLSWLQLGVLNQVPASKPLRIDVYSIHRTLTAIAEQRERGQDQDWVNALVDYTMDQQDRNSPAVKQGLAELEKEKLDRA